MASLAKDGRLTFFNKDGNRKTLRLAALSQDTRKDYKRHVEKILNAQLSGDPIPRTTAAWLGDLSDKMRKKLERVGLCEAKDAPKEPVIVITLEAFITTYIADRNGVEPATKEIWGRAKRNLVDFFGRDKPLSDITLGDAIEFWNWLIGVKGAKLKGSTARKRYTHACMFFLHAVRKKLISENPFSDNGVCKTNLAAEEYRFVPAADCLRILDCLPNTQWKLLFALSRWGVNCFTDSETFRRLG